MAQMRKAGAIPFALTNVSEACMWWESNNLVHGRSRNAYDTSRIVGGSSGGEACLLSASGSPIGIGSDIGGSIRMPAFFNGIFGHKPSKFIVSNEGQWPMPHDDQKPFLGIGPMSRFAVDLKPALKVMAAENAEKLKLDEPVDVSSVKIFYQTDDLGGNLTSPVDDSIRMAMNRVIDHFDTTSKTKPQRKQIRRLRKSTVLWMGNMKSPANANKFDSQLLNLKGRINPYWELAKWFIGQSNHTFIAIMTALTENAGVKYGSSKHQHLINEKKELLKEFETMLGTTGVFLYPTHPTVAPYHNEPIVRAFNFSYTGIINILGLPATACPLGLDQDGLPVGIQVVANVNQDRLCLAVAEELESVFGGFKEPV
ncbi:hypothetical protein HA402_013728 [Bradysia odoriphaga]|nr:hypothetical protein HA402_013728 [Bradysia odoriphaga]